jgi:hypothetical protein
MTEDPSPGVFDAVGCSFPRDDRGRLISQRRSLSGTEPNKPIRWYAAAWVGSNLNDFAPDRGTYG